MKIRCAIITAFVVLQTVLSSAVFAAGETAANFLMLPRSVRAYATGSAFTALAQGPDSVYYNPAGLANGIFNEASASVTRWIEGMPYGRLGYRQSLGPGGLGLAISYLNSGSIPRRPDWRAQDGNYNFQSGTFDVAQGLKLSEALNVGAGVRFIYEDIDGETATALAGSLGAQYNTPLDENHHLWLGLSAENIGTKMGYKDEFSLPALIRAGVADVIFDGLANLSLDLHYYLNDGLFGGGAGVEVNPLEMLALRVGYRFGDDIETQFGFTGGVGIRHIDDFEYVFDISAGSMGELGMIIMFSTGIVF